MAAKRDAHGRWVRKQPHKPTEPPLSAEETRWRLWEADTGLRRPQEPTPSPRSLPGGRYAALEYENPTAVLPTDPEADRQPAATPERQSVGRGGGATSRPAVLTEAEQQDPEVQRRLLAEVYREQHSVPVPYDLSAAAAEWGLDVDGRGT